MRGNLLILALLLFCSLPGQSRADSSPRLIDENRLDYTGGNSHPVRTAIPKQENPGAGEEEPTGPVMLINIVRVTGSSLPAQEIDNFRRRWEGKKLGVNQLKQVTDDLSHVYSKNDYALYNVKIAARDPKSGELALTVVEGYVGDVAFAGDTAGDMSLLQAYAEKIKENRPLRRSLFQRYVLLMGDIPGLSVQARFSSMDKRQGIVRLNVTLKKKPFEVGATYTNQGADMVSRSQFDVRGSANSLFRQGHYTQLEYGFPSNFRNYQLFSILHEQPLGSEGTRASVSFGRLTTDPNPYEDGTAYSGELGLTYPLLRSKNTTVNVSGAFDVLNNENAILAQTATDERTRVLRAGMNFTHIDGKGNGDSGFLTLSDGIDGLGARRSLPYGSPAFFKGNIRYGRDQQLPLGFVARLKATAQLASGPLPSSEQLTYGGPDFGGGYEIASFAGDRGLLAAGELAYPLGKWVPDGAVTNSEIYGFLDSGYLNNIDVRFLPGTQYAASGGVGIRFGLFNKALLQFQEAHPISMPSFFPRNQDRWQSFIQIRTAF